MFLSCRPFVVITLSTGLSPGLGNCQLSKPGDRPVDNVVITKKALQDRNIHILDGTTVENKGKSIIEFVQSIFVIYGLRRISSRSAKLKSLYK